MDENNTRRALATAKPRRRIYFNERDIAALTWTGEQLAVNYVHLQYLLGRLSPQPQRVQQTGKLSIHTVRQVVARWQFDGLVKVRQFIQREPHWVWLTSRGLKHLGLSYPYAEPKLVLLNHYNQVNNVRVYLERKHGDQLQWRCERELLQEHLRAVEAGEAPTARHLPDAEIIYRNELWAIEVELTQKSRVRLDAILAELCSNYKHVQYLAADKCLNAVEAAVSDLVASFDEQHARKVQVRRLADHQP